MRISKFDVQTKEKIKHEPKKRNAIYREYRRKKQARRGTQQWRRCEENKNVHKTTLK